MARIAIESPHQAVEVDLWDTIYEVKEATRSTRQKVRELETKVDGTEDEDTQMEALAEMFDLMLVPVTENGDRKTKASTLIKRKWKADELSISKLMRFFYAIGEAQEEARPT